MDVRDTARAHRLCAESTTIPNGSRYCLVASDRSGELFTHELQAKLLKLYPDVDVRSAPLPPYVTTYGRMSCAGGRREDASRAHV